MNKRVMIVGPYGGKNLGDDLILHQILEALSPFDLDLLVSCSNPDRVAELFNVDACPLLEYRNWDVESLRRIDGLDGIVIGGGEQLSEPRIINPVWGHLARTAHLCRVARRKRVPVMLWAVGLDHLRSGLSRALLRLWVFRAGVVSCLRDQASVDRAKAIMRPDYDGLHLVADPAYALPRHSRGELDSTRARHLGLRPDEAERMLIVPAFDKFVQLDYLAALRDFARARAEAGARIYGWTTDLQEGYDNVLLDLPIWQEIPGFTWLARDYVPPKEMGPLVAEFDAVISARMHPIIVAQTQGVPSYVLARSAKMLSIMDAYGLFGAALADVTAADIDRCLERQRADDPGTHDSRPLALARARAEQSVAHFRTAILGEPA